MNLFPVLTVAAVLAAPLAAQTTNHTLVDKVRAQAGWNGIEIERIRRDGQQIVASGYDRQGRSVSFVRSCASLGVRCAAPTVQVAASGGGAIAGANR